MIICIDIGNTNIKYAIFDGEDLKFSSLPLYRAASRGYMMRKAFRKIYLFYACSTRST